MLSLLSGQNSYEVPLEKKEKKKVEVYKDEEETDNL